MSVEEIAKTRQQRKRIARRSIDPVSELTSKDHREMFRLFSRYYDSVTQAQFLDDLCEKQFLIRLFSAESELVGFSTIQLFESEYQGRAIVTLFSGDTVIDQACWGQKALQRAFVSFLLKIRLKNPRKRVFWFLITKGYKTYLLMCKNFRCYPNVSYQTPVEASEILDRVATLKYPKEYDRERGIIVFEECAGKVKSEFEDLSEAAASDPHIAFFLERNPGYREGHELCCLAEIKPQALLYIVWKYFILRPVQKLFGG